MMKDEAVYVWPQQQHGSAVEYVALNNHDKVDQRSYSPIPGLKARGPPVCAKAISAGAKTSLFQTVLPQPPNESHSSPVLRFYYISHMHTCRKKLSVDHAQNLCLPCMN